MAIENVVLVTFEEEQSLPGGNRPEGGKRRGARRSACGGRHAEDEDGTLRIKKATPTTSRQAPGPGG